MAPKFDKTLFACFTIPLVLDRFTKYLVISNLWPSKAITAFFDICLTHNQGIAWGIGNQMETEQSSWLHLLIAGVLLYFAWYMKSMIRDHKSMAACLFIISGGISNFFDRLWYGTVIDFIQLHAFGWYFPVFNVADISITIGAILLIYFVLFDDGK